MDWNNDGRKDLITGERDGYIRIYLNTGSDAAPAFSGFSYLQVGDAVFDCGYSSKPDVVDWNNDGRKDVLCGEDTGRVYLLLNTGTDAQPAFSEAVWIQNGSVPLDASSRASPCATDWNRDGKKDLLVGNTSGYLYFYENRGTDASPVFNGYTLLSAGGTTLDFGNYSRPAVSDWDNDGGQDILCGCYYTNNVVTGVVFYVHSAPPAAPYVYSLSNEVSDADADGQFEPGDELALTFWLKNSGTYATNAQATLAATDPCCTVLNGSWPIGDIPMGGVCSNAGSAFDVRLDAGAALGTQLDFALTIVANAGSHTSIVHRSVTLVEPEFSLLSFCQNDYEGNTNGAPQPGESVLLAACVSNAGYRVADVVGHLAISDASVDVTYPDAPFGTVECGAAADNKGIPFRFDVVPGAPDPNRYTFVLTLTAPGWQNSNVLALTIGEYGVGSTAYSWVDTSGGTTVALGVDQSVLVNIGFDFPFYGSATNALYLVSNGFLVFGKSSIDYINDPIPTTDEPNGIIAPFWDDLNPSTNGFIRHGQFGSEPNRYWAAEWNAVQHYPAYGELTFEVVLFENGTIKMLYGPMSGPYAYGWSATIGIEDFDGRTGVEHSCDQASAVSNGTALLFQMFATSADSDADGVPDDLEQFYFGGLGSTGAEDTDGDGMSNSEELYAGTNPNDPGSVLWVRDLGTEGSPGTFVLEWPCVPGKPYTVETTTNLTAGWVLDTPAPVAGAAGGTLCHTTQVYAADSVRYFRVGIP